MSESSRLAVARASAFSVLSHFATRVHAVARLARACQIFPTVHRAAHARVLQVCLRQSIRDLATTRKS